MKDKYNLIDITFVVLLILEIIILVIVLCMKRWGVACGLVVSILFTYLAIGSDLSKVLDE